MSANPETIIFANFSMVQPRFLVDSIGSDPVGLVMVMEGLAMIPSLPPGNDTAENVSKEKRNPATTPKMMKRNF